MIKKKIKLKKQTLKIKKKKIKQVLRIV